MNLEYYKSFLWPPEEFLQNINFEQKGYWGIEIIPYIEAKDAGFIYSFSEILRVKELWMTNYRRVNELNSKQLDAFDKENKSQGFTQRSLVSLSEMIKNTFEHGNKGRVGALAHFGYWLTEEGVVVGIRDEGDFYSREETREKIEQKTRILSTKEIPSGSGISRCLYNYSDFLRVVPEQNALFAGFLFKSFIEE